MNSCVTCLWKWFSSTSVLSISWICKIFEKQEKNYHN